jgi:hypothetical protein
MATRSLKTTTIEEIKISLAAEGAAFYSKFQTRHPEERVYAFLFELSAVGYAAAAAIATEESLARFAGECAESYEHDLNRAKDDLRWAGPENGWSQSTDADFRLTNKLLSIAEKTGLYGEYAGTLEKAALSALERMAADGAFGEASEVDRITIGICHVGGDNSEDEFVRWAACVNSPSAMKRLKAQLKKGT